MTTQLTDVYSAEEIIELLRSWEAWSATNIPFRNIIGEPEVLLGHRSVPAQSIPEAGSLVLIGGFNTELPGPAMRTEVADAHLFAQLGIHVPHDNCSDFLECEYDVTEIPGPLKTKFGEFNIKRTAFDRIVFLDEEQLGSITPQGKIKAITWATKASFQSLVASKAVSFPYQVDHVLRGFAFAELGQLPAKVDWVP